MSCCGERYFFGCYSACDVVALPILATYTGTMTVIWTFAGNQITKEFEVEEDMAITLPNIFNENSTVDFQLEDENDDPVIFLDGETEWVCFRFENNESIAAAAQSATVKEINLLKNFKSEIDALREELEGLQEAVELCCENNQAIPSLSTAQRNAIISLEEGMVVYDNQLKVLMVFDGTNWLSL